MSESLSTQEICEKSSPNTNSTTASKSQELSTAAMIESVAEGFGGATLPVTIKAILAANDKFQELSTALTPGMIKGVVGGLGGGTTLLVAIKAILASIGFTQIGVRAGSTAANLQALYGGRVPAGSLFSITQSVAMGGTMPFIAGGALGAPIILAGVLGALGAAILIASLKEEGSGTQNLEWSEAASSLEEPEEKSES